MENKLITNTTTEHYSLGSYTNIKTRMFYGRYENTCSSTITYRNPLMQKYDENRNLLYWI